MFSFETFGVDRATPVEAESLNQKIGTAAEARPNLKFPRVTANITVSAENSECSEKSGDFVWRTVMLRHAHSCLGPCSLGSLRKRVGVVHGDLAPSIILGALAPSKHCPDWQAGQMTPDVSAVTLYNLPNKNSSQGKSRDCVGGAA